MDSITFKEYLLFLKDNATTKSELTIINQLLKDAI